LLIEHAHVILGSTLIAVSASTVTSKYAISKTGKILLWRVGQLAFSRWVGDFKMDYTCSCQYIVD